MLQVPGLLQRHFVFYVIPYLFERQNIYVLLHFSHNTKVGTQV
jgi:hypothetical protein